MKMKRLDLSVLATAPVDIDESSEEPECSFDDSEGYGECGAYFFACLLHMNNS